MAHSKLVCLRFCYADSSDEETDSNLDSPSKRPRDHSYAKDSLEGYIPDDFKAKPCLDGPSHCPPSNHPTSVSHNSNENHELSQHHRSSAPTMSLPDTVLTDCCPPLLSENILEIDVSHLVMSTSHSTFENDKEVVVETENFYNEQTGPSSTHLPNLDHAPLEALPSLPNQLSLSEGLEAVQLLNLPNMQTATSLEKGLEALCELMPDAVCPSTRRQYGYAYRRWTSFCVENSLPILPANVEHVSACVALTAKETGSVSAAEMLSAAISYEHRKAFLPTPTQHPSHLFLMKAIKRKYSRERCPATPVTKELLGKMIRHLFQKEHGVDAKRAPLTLWRTIWRVAIEFHTLSRFSDLIKLKVSSLRFVNKPEKHLLITFPKTKNNQFSENSTKIVASNSDFPRLCPVLLTRLYLERLGLGYAGYLIPRVRTDTCRNQHPEDSFPLSYTTALEDFRDLLVMLGEDASLYGEHSGKRGGASCASEAGMSTDELQRFGGWKSQTMAAKYTDLSLNRRLMQSKKLM
jgi:hypothetical protein